MLLFITSPITSLPNLCKLLKEFSWISGLKVNYSKSSALNISLKSHVVSSLQNAFEFRWSDTFIDYLGIKLTAKTELLYSANFPHTYRKLETDLGNWAKGGISWLGRIHAVKMTLLPRLLYLFRALPINIVKDYLSAFQRKVIKFIWGGKGHRLQQNTLFLSRSQGGLGLPQLFWYYQAARLAQISVVYAKTEKPDWIQIER